VPNFSKAASAAFMAESRDRRGALDACILLDLAEGKQFALDLLGVVRENYCPHSDLMIELKGSDFFLTVVTSPQRLVRIASRY
jgi:hypothetical protein